MLNYLANHLLIFFFFIFLPKLISADTGYQPLENTGPELQRKKTSDNFHSAILSPYGSLLSGHQLIQKVVIMEEVKSELQLLTSCEKPDALGLSYSVTFSIFPFWVACSYPSRNPNPILFFKSQLKSCLLQKA